MAAQALMLCGAVCFLRFSALSGMDFLGQAGKEGNFREEEAQLGHSIKGKGDYSMKYILRYYISRISSYIEIYLSVVILFGVAIGSFGLIKKLADLLPVVKIDLFHDFLGFALALVIAVEFVKMLSRHTPGNAIEVLLFALARKLIVSEDSSFDLLLGVIAIGILFLIRRYLFTTEGSTAEGFTISAATMVSKARKLTGFDLPTGIAYTVGGLVAQIAKEEQRKLREGEEYVINGIRMRINKLRDGIIETIGFPDKKVD